MKTALVTGANRGIGQEVARRLAIRAFHVFVGARNAGAGRAVVEAIAKSGGKATFLQIDVADNASVTAAAREFSKIADHVDILVSNAGFIEDGDTAILEISDELLRKTFETNTLGALRVTRAFAPLLAKSKAPRDQYLEWRRAVNWWRRWLGAGLLHLEDGAERRYVAARGGVAEGRREFGLSWLGTHRSWRTECNAVSRRRRGHDRLARHRCAAEPYRQILA